MRECHATVIWSTAKNFAMAVDIIIKGIFLGIKELILDYTGKVLDIGFTRFLAEAHFSEGPVLIPFSLAAAGKYKIIRVYDSQNNPNTKAAYYYLKETPLWVVNKKTILIKYRQLGVTTTGRI